MDITIGCPHCAGEFIAKMSNCGHEVDCTSCEKEFTIPLQDKLVAGNVIADHVIIKQVGEGSMGQVFLAEHVLMGRRVALKTIRPQSECEGGSAKQFISELQNCAILEHPNIVTTYAAGFESGTYYLTMQFIEGEDVSEVLEREGKLSTKESLKVLKSIAEALSYAWSEYGMMHRDIKPENIRKNKRGDYILMDFGLASVGQTENDGFVYGTPDFMSPEQAQLKELDFKTDMYALGLVIMNLLSAKRPFVGEPEEVLKQQIKLEVPALYDFDSEIENVNGLSELIAGMVEKDPRDRWTSWEMLIRKVDAILDVYGKPQAAPAVPKKKKPTNKSKNGGVKPTKKKPGIKVSGASAAGGRRSIRKQKSNALGLIVGCTLLAGVLGLALIYVDLVPDVVGFKPWVADLLKKN